MSVVLDRIRHGDNVSRSSLSRELDLSFPAISRIVEALIEKNYVVEIGPGKSSGGKRPIILRFNNEYSYVIGIGVDVDFIDVMLADFSGNEVNTIYERFIEEKSPEEMIKLIVQYVYKIIEESGIHYDKVKVVSLGLPAMQDTETGVIRLCPTIPNWEGINLREILTNELQMDVLIDNVANMSMLGEAWKGAAKGYNNVILIGIGTGIGAGILINGRLYRGANGSAGEIGFLYVDKNMTFSSSKLFGQFEYLASNSALKRVLMEKGIQASQDLRDIIKNEAIKSSIFEIIDSFAYGVANLIAVLNPELVVIKGDLFYEDGSFFSYLKSKIGTLIPFKTRLVKSLLREKDVTYGAVDCALNYLDMKILSPFFQ
ncbi:hypothetical protein AMJ44_08095 [candidate division WOR-1 bacterium DG_54_3]|uniref:HTH marR-type domain-containing protein n=1 Tax=candidate division WOR-1 bacterium DG_54_3 TaxID=1703775 RepID=A0A0S7XVX4_UNCSA|nr:MAG: hypothetical protein AMJ44_08095 [candidate division WOR-1 bacterium DG_54_3]